MRSVADAAALRLLGSEQSPSAIDLSVGEPDFDTPEVIRRAGEEAIRSGATRYTPRLGRPELRESVRARLARDKAYEAAFEDTIITAGGSPGTSIAIAATCRRGDSILIAEPSWPNYELFAHHLGVRCSRYVHEPSREIDFDELERLVDDTTRLLVLNSPSNPAGAVATRREVEQLVEFAERRGLWILSDEAYETITYDGLPAWSPCALGGRDRTFASYTFSKTYAMTGWRVGYLIIPSSFRRAALELQATISGCAPAMSQRAAECALAEGDAAAKTMHAAYERRRNMALDILGDSGLLPDVPMGAFYLWLDIGRTSFTGLEFTQLLAREADVLVSAGEVYSDRSDHRVRVSLTAGDDQLRLALERIRSVCERLTGGGGS